MTMNLKERSRCVVNRGEDLTAVDFNNDVQLSWEGSCCVVNCGENLTAVDFDGNVSLTKQRLLYFYCNTEEDAGNAEIGATTAKGRGWRGLRQGTARVTAVAAILSLLRMLVGSRVAGAASNVGEEMAKEEGHGYGRRGLQLRLQILEQGRRQRRPKERAEMVCLQNLPLQMQRTSTDLSDERSLVLKQHASSLVMELRLESEDTTMREERHGEAANANPDCGLRVAVELESLEEWCGEGKEEAENVGAA
ncbi:hypothetical protein BHE74_00049692 [Ensete ventricosum]|nr:hypothetical protein BHE74_00049692 [Ensete ventricosum]